jgi:hypothetical protein
LGAKVVTAVVTLAVVAGFTLLPGAKAAPTTEMVGTWSGSFNRTDGVTTGTAQVTLTGDRNNVAAAPQTGTCTLASSALTCVGTGTLFDATTPVILALGKTFSYQNRGAGIEKTALGNWRIQVDRGPATLVCAGVAVVTINAAGITWSPADGPCLIAS